MLGRLTLAVGRRTQHKVIPSRRLFCSSSSSQTPVIDYDTLVKRMKENSITVVDVRGEDEVAQTGSLRVGDNEGLNVPLPRIVEGILGFSDADFFNEFGYDKPKTTDSIAFSCRSGVRSEAAAQVARQNHGYQDVYNYTGSANEWFSKK